MRTPRAFANQKLYYARIQLDMLAHQLEQEQIPHRVLLDAMGESIQNHLRDAYGWLLLELAQLPGQYRVPPTDVSDLLENYGAPEQIRAEIELMRAQEQRTGWLQQMLNARPGIVGSDGTTRAAANNLATGVSGGYELPQLQAWHESLSALLDGLGDTLEEC